MIAYGKKKIRHNFEDYHPRRGYENWWENEFNTVSKKRARQEFKQQIKEELKEIV
jgi:hypothetical protein